MSEIYLNSVIDGAIHPLNTTFILKSVPGGMRDLAAILFSVFWPL